MKDYAIIRAVSIDELTSNVRHYISTGWEPIGGVVIVANGVEFYQTMIKR